ncbi:MAG: type II toxin-antitoxin system VapC family toxin [Spirochaetaceae bacterium]|nr:type II toxin-antitoxin system VapC family toxin [Spirochaetaceae bacterium]
MITLDTHVAVWWSQTPEHLSPKAVETIRRADRLLVPSIVFWEVALLVRKERLRLNRDQAVAAWAERLLSIPRVQEVPLTHGLAMAADASDMHPDPADRFIATTAHHHHAPLVTKDQLLRDLGWLSTVW